MSGKIPGAISPRAEVIYTGVKGLEEVHPRGKGIFKPITPQYRVRLDSPKLEALKKANQEAKAAKINSQNEVLSVIGCLPVADLGVKINASNREEQKKIFGEITTFRDLLVLMLKPRYMYDKVIDHLPEQSFHTLYPSLFLPNRECYTKQLSSLPNQQLETLYHALNDALPEERRIEIVVHKDKNGRKIAVDWRFAPTIRNLQKDPLLTPPLSPMEISRSTSPSTGSIPSSPQPEPLDIGPAIAAGQLPPLAPSRSMSPLTNSEYSTPEDVHGPSTTSLASLKKGGLF